MKQHWWNSAPWRMVQTNMREIDMKEINAQEYVDALIEFGANVCMINTSGIISSYPTKNEYHFQSEYLTGDSLKSIIDLCHENGIRVIGRMDFSKVRHPIIDKNYEWAYIGTDGKIVDYNGDVHVCFNSEYQQRHALDIMKESVEFLGLDGVFLNFGGYTSSYDYSGNLHGDCQCPNCKRRFYEMFGTKLPLEPSKTEPEKYNEFKISTLKEYYETVYQSLKKVNEDLCLLNFLEHEDGVVREEAGTTFMNSNTAWCYDASDLNKLAHSYPSMKHSITSVDFLDISYRLFSVSQHQQALRMAQNLAHGGSLDYYLMGRLDSHDDKSGFEAVSRMYHFLAENEREYTNTINHAEVLLLKPPGRMFLMNEKLADYYGWFKSLSENHLLFDALHLSLIQNQDWSKYRVIILPDCIISDPYIWEKARRYVENGGIFVCSGEAPALSKELDFLGIECISQVQTGIRSAYFRKEDGMEYMGLENRKLLYLNDLYVNAEYLPEVRRYMQMIPAHPFGPPERCYYSDIVDMPAYVESTYGKGEVIYIPWRPARQYYQHLQEPLGRWLYGVISPYVTKKQVSLPPMVELTVLENGSGELLVHLVNLSGFFGGVYYAPQKQSTMTVRVYTDVIPKQAFSLCRKTECRFVKYGGYIELEITDLELFESIVLKFN